MPEADHRITGAREYLASVRKHKVGTLPPSVLVRECAELRRQLGQVLGAIADAGGLPGDGGTEPYCTVCGAWCGRFHGIEGWRHFRGDPAPGGQRELYDAGHEPVIGWSDHVLLAPAERRTLNDVFDDAERLHVHASMDCIACNWLERTEAPRGGRAACPLHRPGMDKLGVYDALAGRLGALGLLPAGPESGEAL